MATRTKTCPKCCGHLDVSYETATIPPLPTEVRCTTCQAAWPVVEAERIQPSGKATYVIGAEIEMPSALRCPNTLEEIPEPFPMRPGFQIIEGVFPCPACGSQHRASYPPPHIE